MSKLVEGFRQQNQNNQSRLVLLTLSKTANFYEPHGFRVVQEVANAGLPPLLVFEYMAGTIVAAISAKSSLVCMELL